MTLFAMGNRGRERENAAEVLEGAVREQEFFIKAFRSQFEPEDEAVEHVLGILTGTATAHFGNHGEVEIDLTIEERAELLATLIKSQKYSLFHNQFFMSRELEALMCGHKPERYRPKTQGG